MGNSQNITDTDSRLLEGLSGISESVYDNKHVDVQISNAVNDSRIVSGQLVKYYPALNKCKVKLDTTGKTVLCEILLLMGGDIMFLYTPSGDRSYCEDLHEPCVLPRGKVRVFVSPFNTDGKEWVMLGYYFPDEFIGFNPSKQGNFKILAFGSLGEYSIRFGMDGLQVVNNGQIVKEEIDNWGESVSDEFYTREDVDGLLTSYENRIKVLEEKLGIQNGTGASDSTGTTGDGNTDSTGNGTSGTGDGTANTDTSNTDDTGTGEGDDDGNG